MSRKDKACKVCMHYDIQVSECRYGPPRDNGEWPKVFEDDWCSEFSQQAIYVFDPGPLPKTMIQNIRKSK